MAATRGSFDAKVDRSGEHHLWLGSRTAAGNGQLRVDGKLRTAAQVAWELEHGEIPPGHRVRGCPGEPSCVAVEHLTLQTIATKATKARAPRGGGSITRLATNKWKVTIDAGRDESGRRRRLVRTVAGTKAQASRVMASLLVDLAEGKVRPTPAGGSCTVDELMAWYLPFARDVRGLEHSTLVGYQVAYDPGSATARPGASGRTRCRGRRGATPRCTQRW